MNRDVASDLDRIDLLDRTIEALLEERNNLAINYPVRGQCSVYNRDITDVLVKADAIKRRIADHENNPITTAEHFEMFSQLQDFPMAVVERMTAEHVPS